MNCDCYHAGNHLNDLHILDLMERGVAGSEPSTRGRSPVVLEGLLNQLNDLHILDVMPSCLQLCWVHA